MCIRDREYPAVARMVAKEIGIDLFDDTTYEACRLMYWPSTSAFFNPASSPISKIQYPWSCLLYTSRCV